MLVTNHAGVPRQQIYDTLYSYCVSSLFDKFVMRLFRQGRGDSLAKGKSSGKCLEYSPGDTSREESKAFYLANVALFPESRLDYIYNMFNRTSISLTELESRL